MKRRHVAHSSECIPLYTNHSSLSFKIFIMLICNANAYMIIMMCPIINEVSDCLWKKDRKWIFVRQNKLFLSIFQLVAIYTMNFSRVRVPCSLYFISSTISMFFVFFLLKFQTFPPSKVRISIRVGVGVII